MSLVSRVVVGGVVGLLVRCVVPGLDPGHSTISLILGIAGACLGGSIFKVFRRSVPRASMHGRRR